MSSSNRADELEALATLRLTREHIDVSGLSDQDRQALSEWWTAVEEPAETLEPEKVEFAGFTVASMFYDPNQEGLEPHLIPTALAIRAFDTAVHLGLPGAEHLAEEFLRDCGFDEAAARRMLLKMVSRAPLPETETLN